MSEEIKELKEKLDNLQNAFIQSQVNNIPVTEKADSTVSMGATLNSVSEQTDVNTSDISDNREGLTETFETTLINADDISALREGLEEVYEMIIEIAESEVE